MDSATYFEVFVVQNFRAYLAAEAALTEAFKIGNAGELEKHRRAALIAAMNVCVPAYHFADAIFAARPAWMSFTLTDLATLRQDVEKQHCQMLRTGTAATDLVILGAVVDAFKHFELRNHSRPVTAIDATLTVATGWGELGWGEGKYGGVDQVIVELNDGKKRALSSILQNVIDMWRRAMNAQLEDFGK